MKLRLNGAWLFLAFVAPVALAAGPAAAEPPSAAIAVAGEEALAPLPDEELADLRGRQKRRLQPESERLVILWDERLIEDSTDTRVSVTRSVFGVTKRFSAEN